MHKYSLYTLYLLYFHVHLNVILSMKYIKPISEEYIKSRLKVYFPIFLFKRSILIAHLNKLLFRKGLYWHLWFHEEYLTSMELFYSIKVYLNWKKVHKIIKM